MRKPKVRLGILDATIIQQMYHHSPHPSQILSFFSPTISLGSVYTYIEQLITNDLATSPAIAAKALAASPAEERNKRLPIEKLMELCLLYNLVMYPTTTNTTNTINKDKTDTTTITTASEAPTTADILTVPLDEATLAYTLFNPSKAPVVATAGPKKPLPYPHILAEAIRAREPNEEEGVHTALLTKAIITHPYTGILPYKVNREAFTSTGRRYLDFLETIVTVDLPPDLLHINTTTATATTTQQPEVIAHAG